MQERAIRTRQAVLEAARAVFAEVGYDGARVDEIAERSGSNKQRIYAYFGSKENLFAAVQAEALAAIAACETDLLPRIEAEPAAIARILVDGYLRFHDEQPRFWRLLAWANLGTLAPSAGTPERTAVLARLRKAFTKAQAEGAVAAGLGFEAWFVTLTAVVLFLFANQKTATVNLGLRLDRAVTRRRIVDEVVTVLEGAGTGATA